MSESCQNKVLQAARSVIAANGVPGLTLDAVAKQAGVSKGGLLHHFPTKNALLSAMIERHVAEWRGDVMRTYDQQPEGPGRFSRALIKLCLADKPPKGEKENWSDAMHNSCRMVLTAVVQDPSLVQPIRDLYRDFARLIEEDGLEPGHADVIVAVVDGMWLYWICDINAIDSNRLTRVRAALAKLIQVDQLPAEPIKTRREKQQPKTRSSKRSTPRSSIKKPTTRSLTKAKSARRAAR